MTDPIREAFEAYVIDDYNLPLDTVLKRDIHFSEYYDDPDIQNNWLIFQASWKSAIDHLNKKTNPQFSDVVSDGGFDPRN